MHKICNKCKDIVAIEHCIRFNTVKDYITIRGDGVTTYVNMEDSTTPYRLHYCRECWDKIVDMIEVSFND